MDTINIFHNKKSLYAYVCNARINDDLNRVHIGFVKARNKAEAIGMVYSMYYPNVDSKATRIAIVIIPFSKKLLVDALKFWYKEDPPEESPGESK